MSLVGVSCVFKQSRLGGDTEKVGFRYNVMRQLQGNKAASIPDLHHHQTKLMTIEV